MLQLRARFFLAMVLFCSVAVSGTIRADTLSNEQVKAEKLSLAVRDLKAQELDIASYLRSPVSEVRRAAGEYKLQIAQADSQLSELIADTLTIEELRSEVSFHESEIYRSVARKTNQSAAQALVEPPDGAVAAWMVFQNSPMHRLVDKKISSIAPKLQSIVTPLIAKITKRSTELSNPMEENSSGYRHPITYNGPNPP